VLRAVDHSSETELFSSRRWYVPIHRPIETESTRDGIVV
jgi:hypothetical protein